MIANIVRQNFYLLFGLIVGLCLNPLIKTWMNPRCSLNYIQSNLDYHLYNIEPAIIPREQSEDTLHNKKKLLRPRYAATELNMKSKLFVAILTTHDTISTKAIAINKTLSHLVDKIMFFIDTPGAQKQNVSHLKLPGIIGFVDTRLILKPFHVLKYIKDNYVENYDFFFIVKDNAYIKGRILQNIANKISVSQEVYASAKIPNSLFCSLDAGALFSNSVLRKMIKNIDWCVKNSFSANDDDNFGRCVMYSANLSCQQSIQDQSFVSFVSTDDRSLLADISNGNNTDGVLGNSLTIYPIEKEQTFYKLHLFNCEKEFAATTKQIKNVREDMVNTIIQYAGEKDAISWPVESQPIAKISNKYDVLRWDYFTSENIYLASDFETSRPLNAAESLDIQIVVNASVKMMEKKYNNGIRFGHLTNGYRRFLPAHGMDYILDIGFINTTNKAMLEKRIEVTKPLGKVEILPVPYVTENRRVNILLPVREQTKTLAKQFLDSYKLNFLEKKEKVLLMMVFLYEHDAPGKDTEKDIFKDLKDVATRLTKIYRKDDNRVIWLSMKLPVPRSLAMQEALLDFAIVDLAIKKFTVDSLILLARSEAPLKLDFINRVRMNTIMGWQIFSAIPFVEYNPIISRYSGYVKKDLVINKYSGRYDSHNTQHISFYIKDYIAARSQIEHLVPVIRSDRHIRWMTSLDEQTMELHRENVTSLALNTIYAMFARASQLHILRAVEPSLRIPFYERDCRAYGSIVDSITAELFKRCSESANYNLGSRGQLAKLILDYESTNLRVA